jgi:hypothetical protein
VKRCQEVYILTTLFQVFDLGSVIFSEKFIDALKSTTVVNSVLSKIASMTNTKVSEEDGRYLLSGKIDDLVMVKELIVKVGLSHTKQFLNKFI